MLKELNRATRPSRSPEDVGKWEIDEKQEGGLLSEEIRNKKYDVIIGNPPYTHLRNLENRRYHAYPKQRDMAQVFVRWALDHMTEKGVISYNILDTWLDIKTCDGALETRKLITNKIREAIQDDDIAKYSMQDGGALRTFIICITNKNQDTFAYNNKTLNYENILKAGFLKMTIDKKLPFKSTSVMSYIDKLAGGRSKNKFGTNTEFWKSFVYYDFGGEDYYLICKRRINVVTENKQIRNDGNWKLIKTNNFKQILDEYFEGEVKNIKLDKEIGIWLLGYSNSKLSLESLEGYSNDIGSVTSKTSTNYELSNSMFRLYQVPDYDYYKENRPEQFNNYMKWIEDNMRDKDKFLKGIDEQFERLIK